jgi:hypothetical protein
MSKDTKSMPKSDNSEKKVRPSGPQAFSQLHPMHPLATPVPSHLETILRMVRKHSQTNSISEEKSIALRRPTQTLAKLVEPLPDDLLQIAKNSLAGISIRVHIGQTSTLSWASAAAISFAFPWDPLVTSQFALFAALFGEYRLVGLEHQINNRRLYSTTGTNLFAMADDPDGLTTSLTLSELTNFARPRFYNLMGFAGENGDPVLRRKVPFSLLARGPYGTDTAQPGGWLPISVIWQGQTIAYVRTPSDAVPGTEVMADLFTRYTVEFRNRFD